MSKSINIEERLRLVRSQYAVQLPHKLANLRSAFEKCDDGEVLRSLRFQAHGLAGSGATFGFPSVSELARQLEALFSEALEQDRLLLAQEQKAAGLLLAALDRAAQSSTAAVPIVTPLLSSSRRVVYLVDDDTASADDLARQLGYFGYQVKTFATTRAFSETVADPALVAVLMDVMFSEGDLAGTDVIAEMVAAKRLRVPVVFISARGDLTARLAAARAGCAAYLEKPVDVRTMVATLDHLLPATSEPERVLIVDDTEELAQHYAYTLQSVGLTTDVVTHPTDVLSHLANFRPDLVLMDMYMPGCTGAELASVIRQFEGYLSVPIVFLSTERDTSRQLNAIKLGGDDFLTKPISPEHLIASVQSRLSRYRAMRMYMTKDGLTGVLNHTAVRERLEVEIARAIRALQPLCFAVIDLDRFKSVNDTYGHQTGDRVLRTLTNLLRQRLRKTDVIGRLGGDEFGVILPNLQADEAIRILNEVSDAFSNVRQYAGTRYFSTCFSCGIAQYEIGTTVEDLIEVADRALYRAKTAGRARVMPNLGHN